MFLYNREVSLLMGGTAIYLIALTGIRHLLLYRFAQFAWELSSANDQVFTLYKDMLLIFRKRKKRTGRNLFKTGLPRMQCFELSLEKGQKQKISVTGPMTDTRLTECRLALSANPSILSFSTHIRCPTNGHHARHSQYWRSLNPYNRLSTSQYLVSLSKVSGIRLLMDSTDY